MGFRMIQIKKGRDYMAISFDIGLDFLDDGEIKGLK